jgi:ketosteroid isomerase-like protein
MTTDRSHEIVEIIERESRAFETSDAELMLTIYHPDMVWAWPPHEHAHDPMEWIMRVGRFNYDKWLKLTQLFMDTHTLIHNRREIKKILMTDEQDGALAVVDIDTVFEQHPDKDSPWHDAEAEGDESEGGKKLHVVGRAAKIYTTVGDEWKLLYQPGTMHYPVKSV